MHDEPHRLRGKTIPMMRGTELILYTVEDWLDRVDPDNALGDSSYVVGHIDDGKTGGRAWLCPDEKLHPLTEEEIIDRWVGGGDD